MIPTLRRSQILEILQASGLERLPRPGAENGYL